MTDTTQPEPASNRPTIDQTPGPDEIDRSPAGERGSKMPSIPGTTMDPKKMIRQRLLPRRLQKLEPIPTHLFHWGNPLFRLLASSPYPSKAKVRPRCNNGSNRQRKHCAKLRAGQRLLPMAVSAPVEPVQRTIMQLVAEPAPEKLRPANPPILIRSGARRLSGRRKHVRFPTEIS